MRALVAMAGGPLVNGIIHAIGVRHAIIGGIHHGNGLLELCLIAQIKAINTKRHDAAVQELEAHAARFNEQVRAYKARTKS